MTIGPGRRLHSGAHLVLDDGGRPVDVADVVAAEWVGILTVADPDGSRRILVPGGTVHAVPRSGGRTTCGIGLDGLELFATDFGQVELAPRCDECVAGWAARAR